MKTFFFDIGGVIANDPGQEFIVEPLLGIGVSEEIALEIYKSYIGRLLLGQISESDFWKEIGNNYNLDITDSVIKESEKYCILYSNQEILNLIDEIHSKGHKAAIITNIVEPTYNFLVNCHDYDRFNEVIASVKLGIKKPEPEIYQLALKLLNATAEQSIFIDDKQRNLDTAVALGLKTILATSLEQIIHDIREYL